MISEAFNLKISNIIDSLKKEVSNIEKYNQAYDLLWEIKNLDNANNTLNGYKINTGNIENQGELDSSIEFNKFIDSMINSNLEKRETIRSEIIEILSSIVGNESSEFISVDGIENAVVLEKFESGCVYQIKTDKGTYKAFVPYNVDIHKEIVVYDSGGMSGNTFVGDGEWNMLTNYFKNEGYDYIAIKSDRQDTSYYYQDLCNRLNLEPDSRLFISFSGGFRTQYEEYYNLSVEQGSFPGVVAMMDG